MTTDDRCGDPRFYQLLEEIAALHSHKNHDYAKTGDPLSNLKRAQENHDYSKTSDPLSNFNRARELGVLVRMSDKWSRIEELSKGKTPKNESLRDSLIDLAVYALLDVILIDEAAAIAPPSGGGDRP